ncbi:MAG TPA: hypothetical protein VGY54_11345 [Polyangiaceae bacterium]|jgi:hypothetical protein|nr:hypothetical protein [Polyangiaceae bacterium]
MRVRDWNRPERLSVAYLLAPLLAVLLTLPIPLFVTSRIALLAIPVYVGLLAAPGYVYVWSDPWKRRAMSPGVELWARYSLLAATAASLGGATIAAIGLLVHAVPLAVISGLLSLTLLRRLQTRPGQIVGCLARTEEEPRS